MLKYFQTKMFHAVYIPTSGHEQFGKFRSFLGIFNKSTNLQNKLKTGKEEKLTWRHLAGPPAGPAQPPLQRAAWLGQAGRQLLDGEHNMRATQLPAASPLPSSS